MFVWALLVLVLDRVSKALALRYLSLGESRPIVDGLVHLTYVRNRGAAFGLFSDWSVLITAMAVLFTIAIVWFYYRYIADSYPGLSAGLAVGLIVGGSCGNLVDRALWGYVVDFVDLRVWPVFNVADAAVTVGAVMMLVLVLREDILTAEEPESGEQAVDTDGV